jgi:dTMP kinase
VPVTRNSDRGLRALIRRRDSTRGLLIAFEGPDGSGKTTQRKLFKKWLESEGHDVTTTKWNSSKLIKPLVKARKAAHALSPEEFSLMHAADFQHRLDTEILPALWDGTTVIADRYLFTGLARDAARGLPFDWLLHVYQPIFWPDIIFYFSVSPRTSGTRITSTRVPTFYESGQDITGLESPVESYERFITRVIREYESLAVIFKFVTIDAERSIHDQHMQIRGLFDERRPVSWPALNADTVLEWLRGRNGRA